MVDVKDTGERKKLEFNKVKNRKIMNVMNVMT
jgi:hypothetical protein